MKKVFFTISALVLSLGISGNVSAATENTDVDETITWSVTEEPLVDNVFQTEEIVGLVNESPFSGIVTYGTSRPSDVWNISNKGQYDFAGSTHSQTLYTNYKFKGKSSYTMKINNTGNNPVTVKAKRLLKTYATTKVSAGKSATVQFSNIQSDTEFYIVFEGSLIKFNGYIK